MKTMIEMMTWIAVTVLVLGLGTAMGDAYTWDGGGAADKSWGQQNNWNPDTVPGDGDEVTFGANADVEVNEDRTVKKAFFSGANITLTIADGKTLDVSAVSGGALQIPAGTTVTVTGGGTLKTTGDIPNGGGNNALKGVLKIAGDSTVDRTGDSGNWDHYGSSAELHLLSGTYKDSGLDPEAGAELHVTEGILVLDGDDRYLFPWSAPCSSSGHDGIWRDGWDAVADDNSDGLYWDYNEINPGKTTVWATGPEPPPAGTMFIVK